MLHKRVITLFLLIFLASISLIFAEDIPYGTGLWDAGSYGNHRVVIRIQKKTDAVWVHIPWRRRDYNPEKKNVIIVDAKTGDTVKNVCRIEINREFGDLVFQPKTVPGEYYVYYLPFEMKGRSNYPSVTYPEPGQTAELEWLHQHGLTAGSLSGKKRKNFLDLY